VFGRFIAGKIHISAPPELIADLEQDGKSDEKLPSFWAVAIIILIPLLLILISTFMNVGIEKELIRRSVITDIVVFIGHPFSALIIATLISILLCLRRRIPGQQILDLSTKSLGPAGIIILVTGAGGVLKQILIDSGIGKILAESVAGSSVPLIFLAWSLSALVRITQGSATVAMITAAGIMAPILPSFNLSQQATALIVVAIAAGATILSHVNDSGFWIVSKYLGMNEKQTLQSWTVMETIIAVCGLVLCLLISLLVN
ncbi:MAG: GntP family permease, partial [Bacteroidales bacterium]|nr:GntP family permease [Bacteroidales bacterium]